MQYMVNAIRLLNQKVVREDQSIVEMVVWQLAEPVPPCAHSYKYRLYFGHQGICRVRYDNEQGKGDHRHIGDREEAYGFSDLDTLLDDFERDVNDWS